MGNAKFAVKKRSCLVFQTGRTRGKGRFAELGDPIWFHATKIVPKTQRLSKVFPLLHLLPFTAFHKVG